MAAPMKKRAINKDEEGEDFADENDEGEYMDDDDIESGDEDGSEEEMDAEVQVDFEARNPEESDFHGIRKLLQQLFLKANINISEIADTILSQNYVGSVIKQAEIVEDDDEDDELNDEDMNDVFGIFSVINITERQGMDSVKQLKGFLLDKCQQCAQKQRVKFEEILSEHQNHMGFLVSERFINIPPQIAPPSYDSLWKEVERAKQKKMKYNFNRLLLICKAYKLPTHSGNKSSPETPGSDFIFTDAENEYFYKASELSFAYSVLAEKNSQVAGKWGDDEEELEPFRVVMVIPQDRLPAIMALMHENLSLPT